MSIKKQNDCGCGKPVKVSDPSRKVNGVKKIIKKTTR